ncbi:NERD domain-containing protein [Geomonas sp. Red32]|uniref:nuclease-related domain-containing protein n=1 Tax=Geomonas sp. Red32 TaxID=2912856 RepID=UPI00202CCA36|nr:nuclease-related domain-containing protein [Geomonas sp. Red32]MCM0083161.1 NERD domain-containing protein [Geomonas sp. Red32]
MIIKKADNRKSDVLELQRLLGCQIAAKQRFLIEREIKCIGSGVRGEDTSAYYIDFHLHDSRRWAVIHDLRIEDKGFVAQIDHLLINRCLDVYVLESKNYYYGIKITPESEFLAWNGKGYVGIESPIEQNRRHIRLLEKVVTKTGLLPTRLGIPMPASYHNYVLVAPTSRIDRPNAKMFDSKMVIKADALLEAIEKRVDAMGVVETFASAAKIVSWETLEGFARSLARLHRPGKIDYAKKFGVTIQDAKPAPKELPATSKSATHSKRNTICETCGVEVESKVVYFCRMNAAKFAGKILCQPCQKKPVPVLEPEIIELTEMVERVEGKSHGTCGKCGSPVDKKVAYFCQINKERFDGKTLCRTCQSA